MCRAASRSRSPWLTALAALLLAGALVGAAGAATTSRLTGTVVDAEDQPLPGVTVTLTSPVLIGGRQVAVSDGEGRFAFNLLPPGQYTLETDLPGFLPAAIEARVALDRETQVQLVMAMEQFAGEIEVTAEAPVVDTSRVVSGESYNQEFLAKAGVGIGGRDYLAVIGNEAGSVGTGNVNVMGSVTSDNVYLVDGLNTTDPVTATFGTNFNYDAIAEVSIQTSGFEAEYGQALGGIVNLVTKSGGNELSGAFDARYRDQSFIEKGDHFDPDDSTSSTRQLAATLGGPILRDRVWFFVSAQQALNKTTPTESPVVREYDGLDYLAKVTWQVNPANRAVLKVSGDPAEISGVNASRFTAPEAASIQEQGGQIYQAEVHSVLSSSALLSVQAGANRQSLDAYPESGDLDLPGWLNFDTNVTFVNDTNAQFSDRNSDQVRTSLTYFVDELLGSHELKAGVEYRRLDFTGNNYFPGDMMFTVRELFDPDTNPDGSGRTDIDGDGWTDYQLDQGAPSARLPSDSVGDLWTYFVQDSWRPLPNVTVRPGLRLDAITYSNDLGRTIADYDELQPRLGVAWDFMGDGRQVLRANWGRFMHPGSVNLADTVNGRPQGAQWTYTGFEYYCLIPNHPRLCNREWLAENRAIDGQELVTVDAAGNEHYWYLSQVAGADPFETVDTLGVGHLESQWSETFTIGYERQLWSETSVEVQYVNKNTRNLIEDVCNNNAWVWDRTQPPGDVDDDSTWTDLGDCTGFVLVNVPGLRRDYEAYIAKFETRYRGLHLLGNYTYSTSEGNSDAEANRSYASEGYDVYPKDYYNFYGYLDDDRRHRVKLNGYLLLPLAFTVGVDASWSSAPAVDYEADCANVDAERLVQLGLDPIIDAICANSGDDGLVYLEPRGSRRGQKNYQLDLQVSKAFHLGSVSLEAIVAVINALGDERPNQYETEEFRRDNPWGTVLTYTQPRRYEIGFRVEF